MLSMLLGSGAQIYIGEEKMIKKFLETGKLPDDFPPKQKAFLLILEHWITGLTKDGCCL
jgi:hypothetical protein